MYAKNGSVPSHASEKAPPAGRERPAGGPRVATSAADRYAPILDGHCGAMIAFAAVCCPLLANFTFA